MTGSSPATKRHFGASIHWSEGMLKDIVFVKHLGGHRLQLRFEDGVEGEVDLSKLLRFRGVLEPLIDPDFVAKVAVLAEHGTIGWPNGVDLDPVVLYCTVKGEPLPDYDRDRRQAGAVSEQQRFDHMAGDWLEHQK